MISSRNARHAVACLAIVGWALAGGGRPLQASDNMPPMLSLGWLVRPASYLDASPCSAVRQATCLDECGGCAVGTTDGGCCDCGGMACGGGCCGACGSLWTVRGSGLYMTRNRPDNVLLMQDTDTPSPTRTFNARDIDFDWQGGYELALIAQPQCGWGAELRFMSLQDVGGDASATTTTSAINPLQINTITPTFVQDVAQVDAAYDSGFHSAEFNLRRECGELAVLIGFRYLELDEQLAAGLTGSAPPAVYSIFTQNRLYGAQIGGEGTLTRMGCLRLDGLAKGGIYYNAARQTTFLSNGVVTQPAFGDTDDAAFVGELGLTAVLDLSPSWSIRAGYQGLWLETVALASDQIPATELFTQSGIDAEGGTFFHGGVLAVEFRR